MQKMLKIVHRTHLALASGELVPQTDYNSERKLEGNVSLFNDSLKNGKLSLEQSTYEDQCLEVKWNL